MSTIRSEFVPVNRPSVWRRFRNARGFVYLALIIVSVFWVFPFIWMVLGAFKTQREIMQIPPTFFPHDPIIGNFTRWFSELGFGTYFTNSVIVASITMAGNLVFCSMVGYALAKIDFAGKKVLFGMVMITLMVPSVATFVPLFVEIANMRLLNTYASLILPFLTQPIGVFMMRQFMTDIPDTLLEIGRAHV